MTARQRQRWIAAGKAFAKLSAKAFRARLIATEGEVRLLRKWKRRAARA